MLQQKHDKTNESENINLKVNYEIMVSPDFTISNNGKWHKNTSTET